MSTKPELKTEIKPARPSSKELKNQQPWGGAEGPEGSRFLGWVLVQLWEPGVNTKGPVASHVNWSGDNSLVKFAADELTKISASM